MRFWASIFALGAALNMILGLHSWPAVLSGSLNDPDSYMRLERILQGIHQGHLVNIVARDDSGSGVLVEWSHLLDILLWLMAAPLAPFLGWKLALFAAGTALGPLGVGVLGMSLAFAARPFAQDQLLWSAAVAAATLPGLVTFAAPGVVHYHILLLALIALTVGYAIRAWRTGGTGFAFLAGGSAGLSIWLTPETMPFVLMALAPLLLYWLRGPTGVLLAAAAGLFDAIGFGFAIDPPQGGYMAAEIDRLSIVYLVLATSLLVAAALLRWGMDRLNFKWRRQAGTAVMAGVLLAWIAIFPKVAEGPFGIMSAADMRRFFGAMQELQPLRGWKDVLEFLGPGLMALVYIVWRAYMARLPLAKSLWGYLAACLLVSLIIAEKFLLFVEFPTAVAAALFPVMLSEATQRWRGAPAAAMLARLAVIAAMIVAPDLPLFAGGPPQARAGKEFSSCDLRQIGKLLAGDAGRVVLAEAQYTPELLYRSDVITVGSLYQHGVPAYLRGRDAWRSAPGATEPAAVRATGASYILFCPGGGRTNLVADLPKTTLWDALEANHAPPWLTVIAADPATGWHLYQIH